MRSSLSLALLALLVVAPAQAVPTVVTFSVDLPEPGATSLLVELYDARTGGTLIYSEDAAIDVVGTVLVADVGLTTPLDDALVGDATLFAQLVLDGVELSPRLRVEPAAFAQRASRALSADRATDASAFAGIPAGDVATKQALSTSGAASVAFANVSNVPAGVADGDNNTAFAPAATNPGLTLSGTQWRASVRAANITANTLTSSHVLSVNAAAIATGAITAAETPSTMGSHLFRTDPACATAELSLNTTCPRAQGPCTGQNKLSCGSSTLCSAGLPSNCNNVSIGFLYPP